MNILAYGSFPQHGVGNRGADIAGLREFHRRQGEYDG